MIQEKIEKIKRQIKKDALVLAATKKRSINQINLAVKSGISIIGESRVQELLDKLPFLPKDLRVDFIGHLQTNKVKDAVKNCFLIHSVDRLRLIEVINKEAGKIEKQQLILLQVNIAEEQSKFGFKKETLINIFPKVLAFKNIKIKGLMTIAPYFDDAEKSRPVFRNLRKLRDSLEKIFKISLPELSMGMSNDYKVAIEEGATIIRLGRIIFD